MGVQQPRAYTMPQHPQMPSSPSMVSAASPATRKRRFMDIILVGEDRELSTSEVDEEAELTQRVTFKRSKSGEAPMSVRVDRTEILCDTSSQPGTPMDKSPTSKDASSPSSSSTKSSRPNMSASQTITLDMLRPHFEKPLAQVAQVFGICVTLLKKICRKNGLARWPHRQIIGLRKSIASMEQAIGHFEGARRDSYAQQLEKQRSKLAKLLEDPTSCNLLAVEDEFLPTQHIVDQHTRATTAQQMTPQTSHYSSYAPSPVYETHAYAPAYSYPTGYSYHSAQPTLASPPRLSYAPQHYYPTPYSQPAAPTHQPSASLTLPPLRTDSRPLPPLSALVGRRW